MYMVADGLIVGTMVTLVTIDGTVVTSTCGGTE